MVEFIIVERTICNAVVRAEEGPAPFTAPCQRRETVPWGKVSEGDANGDAVTANSSYFGKFSNAADHMPAHKKSPGRSGLARSGR